MATELTVVEAPSAYLPHADKGNNVLRFDASTWFLPKPEAGWPGVYWDEATPANNWCDFDVFWKLANEQ